MFDILESAVREQGSVSAYSRAPTLGGGRRACLAASKAKPPSCLRTDNTGDKLLQSSLLADADDGRAVV